VWCRANPIVGPRFECLHCPTTAAGRFNACYKCEVQLHAPGGHAPDHAFQHKMPPDVGAADAGGGGSGGGGGGGGVAAGGGGGNCAIM